MAPRKRQRSKKPTSASVKETSNTKTHEVKDKVVVGSKSKPAASTSRWKKGTVLLPVIIAVVVSIGFYIVQCGKGEVSPKTTERQETPVDDKKREKERKDAQKEQKEKESKLNKPKSLPIIKDTIILGGDSYEVLEILHHDRKAFTQGLTFYNGFLYEGTGMNGSSDIRIIDPKATTTKHSEIKQKQSISSEFFGEGITYYKDRDGNPRIIQLTWKEKTAFVYDAENLEMIQQFQFNTSTGEGWGISFMDETCEFVVSDGSHLLLFWDCQSFTEKRRVEVKYYRHKSAQKVPYLNELEVIRLKDGGGYAVLANVWFQDVVLQINPSNGDVDKIYDFNSLNRSRNQGEDVFNGISIADDKDHTILYLTGKWWPFMYKVQLKR